MNDLLALIKRNILVFLRDKTAVFFSFLSIIIMLFLYFLFLGKLYTQGFDGISDNLKTFLSTSQMMGGILVINTLSLSLGMMGNLVVDLETHKLDAFLVTPVKRSKIIIAYFVSSVIVTIILSFLIWIATILYVGFVSGYWYNFDVIIKVFLLLILFTMISSSLMVLITSFLKSNNAFGTVAGVLGTFIGFVAGIYMPLENFGKGMKYFASIIPFTHMTILLKSILLKEPYLLLENELSKTVPSNELENIMISIKNAYGSMEIGVFGIDIKMFYLLLIFMVLSILLIFLAFKNMQKNMKK